MKYPTALRVPAVAVTPVALALLLAGCGSSGTPAPGEVIGLDSPARAGSLAPHLAVTADGAAVLSWLEPTDDQRYALRFATLNGDTWSAAASVAESDDWFVNWADVPSVVPIRGQQWAAHWLVSRPGGTYAYDIALARSDDAGQSWSAPVTPHGDNTPTEHGFVSLFDWDNDLGAVWLDGRNMPPDTSGDKSAGQGRDYGGMTLRYARFSGDGTVRDEGEIDDLVCECCQTDVALTTAGPIIAYRNRTTDEVRDIAVTRFVDGAWQDPLIVSDDHWQLQGCPVNGPAIDAAGDRVAVAWYGSPDRQSRIKLAWSTDAGRSFATPIVIDDSVVRGRVDVVLLNERAAVVSWMAKTSDNTAELRARQVDDDGTLGPIRVIAGSGYARNAGFPQMLRAGKRLVFAWPEGDETQQVLTAVSVLDDS